MYNAKQKQDFIDSYAGITADNFIQNLFKKCEVIEKELGKDVCNFLKPEILRLFTFFNSSTSQILIVYRSYLRQYTDYCCSNGLSKDNINHYEEVSVEEVRNCVNQYYKNRIYLSPESVQEIISCLDNPIDKYVILALYEGIKGENYEELIKMRIQDVNFETKEVKLCSGRTLILSEQLVDIIQKANNITTCYIRKKERSFPESMQDYILKVYNEQDQNSLTSDQMQSRVFRKMNAIKKELNTPELTAPRLINSGMINLLSKIADEHKITVVDLVMNYEELIQDVKERYEMQNVSKYTIAKIVKEYLG